MDDNDREERRRNRATTQGGIEQQPIGSSAQRRSRHTTHSKAAMLLGLNDAASPGGDTIGVGKLEFAGSKSLPKAERRVSFDTTKTNGNSADVLGSSLPGSAVNRLKAARILGCESSDILGALPRTSEQSVGSETGSGGSFGRSRGFARFSSRDGSAGDSFGDYDGDDDRTFEGSLDSYTIERSGSSSKNGSGSSSSIGGRVGKMTSRASALLPHDRRRPCRRVEGARTPARAPGPSSPPLAG
mmetsp:Transcript_28908/g.69675  ORF Transcript_28908/g.69675 Transcript_28908/m.69675 type:complete len:243 (-) Transcript_28908:3744-4472(-)